MLWIKMLGGFLMLGAAALIAGQSARYEKRKLAIPDAWLELLLYIRVQIDCYLMPIDDILASADKRLLQVFQTGEEKPTLSSLLQVSYPYLDTDTRHLLTSLVRELGSSYREEQLKRCDYYINVLREKREQIATALPSRLKVTVTLIFCTAIGTAVLLW